MISFLEEQFQSSVYIRPLPQENRQVFRSSSSMPETVSNITTDHPHWDDPLPDVDKTAIPSQRPELKRRSTLIAPRANVLRPATDTRPELQRTQLRDYCTFETVSTMRLNVTRDSPIGSLVMGSSMHVMRDGERIGLEIEHSARRSD